MITKKAALSLLIAAASGAYVWSQSGGVVTDDLLGLPPEIDDVAAGGISPRAPATGPALEMDARPAPGDSLATGKGNPLPLASLSPAPPPPQELPPTVAKAAELPTAPAAPLTPVNVPLPRQRPAHEVPVAGELTGREPAARELVVRIAMNARYADGTYTGPVADAYYGPIQIQATVQGGRLVGIKVLQYPSDRRTSILINRQALPMLRDEVVSAQSANVDIISGATLTSKAFIRSLGAALRQAGA